MADANTIIGMKPISADSHVMEPPNCFSDYIDPKFRNICPHVVRDKDKGDMFVVHNVYGMPIGAVAAAGVPPREVRYGGKAFEDIHRGGWDPKARLIDMDRDGLAAEVVFPSVGMVIFSSEDYDYKDACFRAYSSWLKERFVSGAPDRLFGIGPTAARSPAALIKDMQRIKEMGFRGVMMPIEPGEADYDSPIYDPAWAAAVELDLPICFHILVKSLAKSNSFVHSKPRGGKLNNFLSIIRTNQDIIGLFVFGGIFERHPKLKLVCVEADAGWMPHFMRRMDKGYETHRFWMEEAGGLSRLPSEYVRENVYVTFQDDFVAYQTADLVNPERLLWASDFPHIDSTWPRSLNVLTEHTQGVDLSTVKKILHDNSNALFKVGLEGAT